ncbi:MAG: quinolinate synthase NadA [Candidatus Krumholzibacteriota bacterium]|nr:quinolinate synthase NadA [Candidatus Krumholzibacteriota bacterium]
MNRRCKIKNKIIDLKSNKRAIILAHYYVSSDVQDVADFVGDSLDLAMKAKDVDADIIIMAGVKFMAEMVKILNPTKKVLIPSLDSYCEMADMVEADYLEEIKSKNPDAAVVAYVNTSAEVKAMSDICCTSRNAISIVESLKSKNIIFVPDQNMASYISLNTNKHISVPKGFCYVHKEVSDSIINVKLAKYPKAKLLVHPECNSSIQERADFIGSTSAMISFVNNTNNNEFIIATENNYVQFLSKMFPNKKFTGAAHLCRGMKENNIENILSALQNVEHEVIVDDSIANDALTSIDRMLQHEN